MKNKELKSIHIFLFPFNIRANENEISLSDIHSAIVSDKNWTSTPFELFNSDDIELIKKLKESEQLSDVEKEAIENLDKKILYYNEFIYFHKFIRDTLYDIDGHFHSRHYERDLGENPRFILSINDNVPYNYELKVQSISLRIFQAGIGILSLNLHNYAYANMEDILKINDYGRRIYPQFLGGFGKDKKDEEPKIKGIDVTKSKFFPDKISLIIKDQKLTEDNHSFTEEYFLKTGIHQVTYVDYLNDLLSCFKKDSTKDYEIEHIIDDRMFVLCWYANAQKINEFTNVDSNGYNYEKNEMWYKYIFVDGKESGISSKRMMNDLIKSSTYDRFIDSTKSLYGISRYSFVCISDASWFSMNILTGHIQTMYYQLIVLLLAQRASILKYSEEIKNLSSGFFEIYSTKIDDKKIIEKIEETEKAYSAILRFYNHFIHPEITPQEQGIELYNLAKRKMGIDEQFESLNTKINQLYEFTNITQQKMNIKQQNEVSDKILFITALSSVFWPLTVIVGLIVLVLDLDLPFKGTKLIWYLSKNDINIIMKVILVAIVIYAGIEYSQNILVKIVEEKEIKPKRLFLAGFNSKLLLLISITILILIILWINLL